MESKNAAPSTAITIALTGSTGNFGSYLLDLLLANEQVKKVYCLNRSDDARSRQLRQNATRGLSTRFADKNVVFLRVDIGAINWGLDDESMEEFLDEVDVVIHNAWPVDFNRNFASFSSHIDGVRQLIELARRNHKTQEATKRLDGSPNESETSTIYGSNRRTDPIKICLISSIGTVSNWGSYAPTSRDSVPEEELTDWKLARTGYGQSKLLSERLLAFAATDLDVPVTIVRVGQLGGPVQRNEQGAWPLQEWFPSLIKSSKTIKAIPTGLAALDDVDFVPVDLAAQITLELLDLENSAIARTAKKRKGAHFYHLVNPITASWATILPAVMRYLPDDVEEVPIVEWVDRLKNSAGENVGAAAFEGVDHGDNPALKLFETFDYMQDRAVRFPDARAAVLATKETAQQSPTLAALHAVDVRWMEMWMRQWNF